MAHKQESQEFSVPRKVNEGKIFPLLLAATYCFQSPRIQEGKQK